MSYFNNVGGILIRDRKVLVVKPNDLDRFIVPGGGIGGEEKSRQALIRELREEVGIVVKLSDLEEFDTFSSQAVGHPDKTIEMKVFKVKSWSGNIVPSDDIVDYFWVDTKSIGKIKLGYILANQILPKLKLLGFIN